MIKNEVTICPMCGEPLTEVVESFNGIATWILVDGVYKLSHPPRENITFKCVRCNTVLSPEDAQVIAGEIEPIELIQ